MISYEPFRILLVKERMQMQDLRKAGILTPRTAVRLNNDTGHVNTSTLDRICAFLSGRLGRTVAIGEIVEYVPDRD